MLLKKNKATHFLRVNLNFRFISKTVLVSGTYFLFNQNIPVCHSCGAEEMGKEYHDQESLLLLNSTSFRDIWEGKCKNKMKCSLKMNTKGEFTAFTNDIKTCSLHEDNVRCLK